MNAPTQQEANTYTVILLAEGSEADVTLYSTMLVAQDVTEAAHAAARELAAAWEGDVSIIDVIVLQGSYRDLVQDSTALCLELNA